MERRRTTRPDAHYKMYRVETIAYTDRAKSGIRLFVYYVRKSQLSRIGIRLVRRLRQLDIISQRPMINYIYMYTSNK